MNVAKIRTVKFVLIAILVCVSQAVGQTNDQSKDSTPKPAPAQTRNSLRKIRVKPSAQASRIGSAINWETKFEDAAQKSKELNKPIFWYVPTLRGTFMDRKNEIDRYVRASLFSWPDNIETINNSFIPFRGAPTRDQQKQFELVPFKFVEPGFLILKPNGELTAKVDQITTMHSSFLTTLFSQHGFKIHTTQSSLEALQLRKLLKQGSYTDEPNETPKEPPNPKPKTAQLLLKGMIEFRKGHHDKANKIWRKAAEAEPENPLAWKAAAEAEGFGPFVRGFEVFGDLPARANLTGIESRGSSAPNGTYTEKQLWDRSIKFLLGMQRSDGGWVDSDYDFGGTDSLPNVHVAVTSLCGMALMEYAALNPGRDDIKQAIGRAAKFVSNEKNLNRVDKDEILWALAFRTRFLSRLVANDENYRPQLAASAKALQKIQTKQGSWYHEYSNPFVTATALLALHEARVAGFQTDSEVIKKGIAALGKDRFGNGAFPYSTSRATEKRPGDARQIVSSAGRMPLCESALSVWEESDQKRLQTAIEASLKHHDDTLKTALKYDDHTSNSGYGGFFFWYDMRGRSEAISEIENGDVRKRLQQDQRKIVLSLPEIDGCFVDSHELGRCYGTAMALLTLARCND